MIEETPSNAPPIKSLEFGNSVFEPISKDSSTHSNTPNIATLVAVVQAQQAALTAQMAAMALEMEKLLQNPPFQSLEPPIEATAGALGENPLNLETQSKIHRKEQRPTVWKEGQANEFITWLSKFEKIAQFNKWDDANKCENMAINLEGAAARHFDTLTWDVQCDWPTLRAALIQRFKGSPTTWARQLRTKWDELSFQPNKHVDFHSYADQMMWLAKERQLGELECVAHLLDKGLLHHPAPRQDLTLHPPASLHEALQRCEDYFSLNPN